MDFFEEEEAPPTPGPFGIGENFVDENDIPEWPSEEPEATAPVVTLTTKPDWDASTSTTLLPSDASLSAALDIKVADALLPAEPVKTIAHEEVRAEQAKSPVKQVAPLEEQVKTPVEQMKTPVEQLKTPEEPLKTPEEQIKTPEEPVKATSDPPVAISPELPSKRLSEQPKTSPVSESLSELRPPSRRSPPGSIPPIPTSSTSLQTSSPPLRGRSNSTDDARSRSNSASKSVSFTPSPPQQPRAATMSKARARAVVAALKSLDAMDSDMFGDDGVRVAATLDGPAMSASVNQFATPLPPVAFLRADSDARNLTIKPTPNRNSGRSRPISVPTPRTPVSGVTLDGKHYSAEFIYNVTICQATWRRRKARLLYRSIVKRSLHARELFDTEKVYVDGLHLLLHFYEKPMRDRSVNHVMQEKHVDVVFYQIKELLACHERLYGLLNERFLRWSMHQRIGDLLLSLREHFETYTLFVNNYDKMATTIRKYEQNSAYTSLVSELQARSASKLKLTDLLITPVQRIPRYQLLLGPILKLTPEDHPDRASLLEAAEEMRRLAEHINERKREADARIKVVEIQARITGDVPNIVTESRRFVREGDIVAAANGERTMRHLFLFNDALLCTARLTNAAGVKVHSGRGDYEFEWMIPLHLIAEVEHIDAELHGNMDPRQIMRSIKKLERQRDVERNIEQKAARMADLYKQTKSDSQRTARKEASATESNIEQLDALLRQQRELMRLYEPSIGLLITTTSKQSFTFVVRSHAARDEWTRDIDAMREACLAEIDAARKAAAAASSSTSADGKRRTASGGSTGSAKANVANALDTVGKKIARTLFGTLLRMGSNQDMDRRKPLPAASKAASGGRRSRASSNASASPNPAVQQPAPPTSHQLSQHFAPAVHPHTPASLASSTATSSLVSSGDMSSSDGGSSGGVATHTFQSRAFKRPTRCDICDEFIWGLGREGVKCIECSMRLHRRCLVCVSSVCSMTRDAVIDRLDDANDAEAEAEIAAAREAVELDDDDDEKEQGRMEEHGRIAAMYVQADQVAT